MKLYLLENNSYFVFIKIIIKYIIFFLFILILNDYIFKFNNYCIKTRFIENKKIIDISYSTDNKYIYPTIVSMISLILNADKNTLYNIYILHSNDFNENSKKFLIRFQNKFDSGCRIILINMGDSYKNLKHKKRLSIAAYYRLSLPSAFPNINKIIYLDCDTLVLGDLKELIDFDMKDNVIMGFIDYPDSIKLLGLIKSTVICSGVLLFNLELLRKYNYSKKIDDFIAKYKSRLILDDQTILNIVMQDKLGTLPPKYGIFAFRNEEHFKNYFNKTRKLGKKYNKKDLLYAIEHPVIIHFAGIKPFGSTKNDKRFSKVWWKFARVSGVYNKFR